MTLHVYDKHSYNSLYELSEHDEGILRDNPRSDAGQDLLSSLKAANRWIACDCKQPMALMYIRYKDFHYSLVNHYEKGVHDPSRCRFFSSVMGGPKEVTRDTDEALIGDDREDAFFIFRKFAPDEEQDKAKVSSKASPSLKKRDSFLRIYDNLIESTYQNFFHGKPMFRSQLAINKRLFIARDASSEFFVKGTKKKLLDVLYVGKKGYEIAVSELLKAKSNIVDRERPTAIVLLLVDQLEFNKRTNTLACVSYDDDGVPSLLHLNDLVKPPVIEADVSLPMKQSCIVIAGLTFINKEDELPVVGKVAIQPIVGEGSICPVENAYERWFVLVANSVILEWKKRLGEQEKLYVQKPSLISYDPTHSEFVLTLKTQIKPLRCLVRLTTTSNDLVDLPADSFTNTKFQFVVTYDALGFKDDREKFVSGCITLLNECINRLHSIQYDRGAYEF